MADLQEAFKYSADKLDKDTFIIRNAVSLTYRSGNNSTSDGTAYRFDFLLRAVTVVDTKEAIHFRDFDRDVLEFMRNKLIGMGGNPPPLPLKETGHTLSFKPRGRENCS